MDKFGNSEIGLVEDLKTDASAHNLTAGQFEANFVNLIFGDFDGLARIGQPVGDTVAPQIVNYPGRIL